MTLQNLLGVSLDAVTPERAQVARMLAAAERNMADEANFEKAEELAERLEVSRSQLYARAIREYTERYASQRVSG